MTTEIEYALMAGHAYRTTRDEINWFPIPQGWTPFFPVPDSTTSNFSTTGGFEAVSFKSGTEIVISFAGTYDSDISGDIAADIGLATGFGSEQLLKAAEYYLQVRLANPGINPENITLTGHSLGGGLAALVGVFFGVKAVTFDQAPFANSAQANSIWNPLTVLTPDVAADLKDSLLLQGYSEADLAGLSSFLELREANGGIPNSELVTNLRVDGELLSSAPLSTYNPIGTTPPENVLDHGPYANPSVDMHSMALLTVFLQSAANSGNPQQTLSEVTRKLTSLLEMIFDENLYARTTDPTNATDVNLLEHLIQHQEGPDPTVPNDGDAMVSRFTADLWKIAQEGGLSLGDTNIAKALTAFAMQKYYEEPASGADHGQLLFNDVSGGFHFNRAYVADILETAKGYKYFLDYVGSLSSGSNRDVLAEQLPGLLDWYIQAGKEAMKTTAGDERAFMLGGSGGDILTGGNQADLLVGNSGKDTLDGGAGDDMLMAGWKSDGFSDNSGDTLIGGTGADTLYGGLGSDTMIGGADADLMIGEEGVDSYHINGHDTIQDTGSNFIYFKDESQKYQLLAGGFVQEKGTNTYRFLSDENITLTFNSPGHLVLNDADSITFENQTSAAAFENGDFGMTLYDSIAPSRVLTGTSGDDTTDALVYSDNGLYCFDGLVSGGQPDLIPGWGEFYMTGDTPPDLEIDGGAGNDQLVGLAGSDFIRGGSGNDILNGDFAWSADDPADYSLLNPWGETGKADILLGEAGKDVILAGYGDDAVSGGDDNDFLAGGEGDDAASGDAGDDVVTGSIGNDSLSGGSGNDLLYGDGSLNMGAISSADIAALDFQMTYDAKGYATAVNLTSFDVVDAPAAGDDLLYAGAGNDVVKGGAGNDILLGEADHDTLIGGSGDDYMDGGAGNDWLVDDETGGNAGNDSLHGGGGNDLLEGGAGNDTYTFALEDGYDTVDDDSGANRILFGSGVTFADLYIRLAQYDENTGQVSFTAAGQDLWLEYDATDGVLLRNGAGNIPFTHEFADGSVVGHAQVLASALSNTPPDSPPSVDSATGSESMDFSIPIGTTIMPLTVADISLAKLIELLRPFNVPGSDYVRFNMATGYEITSPVLASAMFGVKILHTYTAGPSYSVSGLFDSFSRFPQRSDPFTLDMDGDGLETVSPNAANPVLFDLDGDGIKNSVGWIGPDDGLLVLDRNGNGAIDDGRELFGDATPVFDSEGLETGRAADGFAALAQEDTNGDGVVDSQDARWNELRLWQDANQDGVSQEGELRSMAEAGIASINVAKTEHLAVLANGNALADLGSYTRTDGQTGTTGSVGQLADIDLAVDTFHSQFTDSIPLTGEAENLPDMQGSGQVRSLRQAASLQTPEGAALANLLAQYAQAASRGEQLALLDRLLKAWSDTSIMPTTFTGAYAGHDLTVDMQAWYGGPGFIVGGPDYLAWADKLTVMERFNGRTYQAVPAGNGPVTFTLWHSPRDLLQLSYDALKGSVYDGLLLQTRLKPYMKAADLVVDETGIRMDYSGTVAFFQARYTAAPAEAVRDLFDLQRIAGTEMNGMGWDGYGLLRGWLADAAGNTADPALLPAILAALAGFGYPGLRADGNGTAASEAVIGADAGGILTGQAGNDLVLGGAGDDALNGGTGSDLLYGGAGNDIYVFNAGDGIDTIVESHGDSGTDALQLGAGILAGDLDIYVDGDKLVFTHTNGRDSVSIANWFGSLAADTHRLDALRFADGKLVDLNALRLGGDRADTLTGTAANNLLAGDAADDVLAGGAGDDLLHGGTGDDAMAGGTGNDTYVVDSALDKVIEAVEEGVDTVEARVSYTLSDNVENLVLAGAGPIRGIGNELGNTLIGNSGNNALYGLEGDDILAGGAGNDLLDGGKGVDAMSGGSGGDSYVVDTLADTVTELAGQGTDTVYANLTYTLDANVENLTLTGSEAVSGDGNDLDNAIIGNDAVNVLAGLAGNDILDGWAGADTLIGGSGNDTLNGGAGADSMLGGTGDDIYIVDNADDTVIENAGEGSDTVKSSISRSLSGNVENLILTGADAIDGIGNELNNAITGNAAVNVLTGLAGNDILDGGAGADSMLGGTGDDIYVVESSGDLVTESLAEGVDTVRSSIGYTLGANLENLALTGGAAIDGIGNELDNVIVGNSAANTLDGGLGADNMAGGRGNDTYLLDNLGDTVTEYAGQGTDTVVSPFDYVLGANVENLILTGTALNGIGNKLDNVIVGADEDNTLTGLAGNDTLDGGAGTDMLIGGTGDDTYLVDNLDDTLVELAGEGIDTVKTGLTWTLTDNIDNLTLTGSDAIAGTGNELDNGITGNSAVNTLSGLTGNDTLDGGLGADTLVGGLGNDTYIVDNDGDLVIENAGEGIDLVKASIAYTLTAGVENLTLTGVAAIAGIGNEFDNVIAGNSAVNILTGLGGNDTLDGGAGADTMTGGTGDDAYLVDNSGDAVMEAVWEGMDSVRSSATYTLGANIENLTLIGDSSINGIGNELDNVITGNSGSNRLDGGAGADLLAGGSGNDTYVIDDSGDLVTEAVNAGFDSLEAAVNYTLADNVENLSLTGSSRINGTGNSLSNTLTGNAGDNLLYALEGNDTLNGQAGNDLLDGGSGADAMTGGAGDDVYVVENSGDAVAELAGEGTDTVHSSIAYILDDSVENLILTGGADIDGIGNELDNVIAGNSGNNLLDGGSGSDLLAGGTGDDTYIVGEADDLVTEAADEGMDTVRAGNSYTLTDNVENLLLTGTGDLTGSGNVLANTITGTGGNNLLDGGAGIDIMFGGAGDDIYLVDDSADLVMENADAGIDTVLASASYVLSGHIENITLTGKADSNATGNALNNILIANSGINTLTGGAGNDIYILNDTADAVVENAGEGTDLVQSSITHTLTDNVENLTLTGAASIDGTGNAQNNTILGNSGDNVLDGAGGADQMAGGAGNDSYLVDNAGDVVTEASGAGSDTVLSSTNYALTANVENLTLTGDATINGTGNSLNNIVSGNTGNNVLNGGTGVDTMVGSIGDDTYLVDNSGDIVVEATDEGTDLVQSSVTYTLSDNVENLTLTDSSSINGTGNELDNIIVGNSGHNLLSGLTGNDTLMGNSGNDTLDGGTGADSMAGNAGNDTYIVDDIGDVVTEAASAGTDLVQSSITYTLTANVEKLTLTGSANIDGTGNTLSNVIVGNSGANTLSGGAGNDTLDGGAGIDSMAGNSGDDTYVVDNIGDLPVENNNEGRDLVQSSISWTLAANIENLTLTGTASINGTGNELDNVITGNSGANALDGLSGNDTLYGNSSNDVLAGGAGNDTMDGGGGVDSMIGGSGNDTYVMDSASDAVIENAGEGTDLVQSSVTHTLSANVENLTLIGSSHINGTGNELDNVIVGNSKNNVLSGLEGNDSLTGNSGNDTLDGGTGADSMAGNAGNDTYVVDDSGDVVTEASNAGTDLVHSSISWTLAANVENLALTGSASIDGTGNILNNVITGNSGANSLEGGAGADSLYAGAGNDIVTGGDGNDLLDGGTGADTMAGGTGNDTCVVDSDGDLVAENANEGTDLVQSSISWTLTDNFENLALTGSANIDGTGNELNNVITGNSGANRLSGLVGNDTYVVDNTGDLVVENADDGVDTVQSSISHTLSANVEKLTLTGTASINGIGNELDNVIVGNTGNNELSGLAGNDTLTGNTGNDTLDGGTGADSMTGNAGNDTYVVDDISDGVTETTDGGTDTVLANLDYTLGSNVENLTMAGGADLNGTGNNLNNIITGNDGANILDGSGGADTLIGGAGDDTYFIDKAGDAITELAGGGKDTVYANADYVLAANLERLTLTGSANLAGTGNAGDNVIAGNSGANTISGGDGNDIIDGGLGEDAMSGGLGDDLYIVDNAGDGVTEATDGGMDTVRAGIGYTLTANVENLVLTGEGDHNGAGNAGSNCLTGNAGNNVLDGGAGADLLTGGAGNDTHMVDDAGDVVIENADEGIDLVQTSAFHTLSANVENLTMTGTASITGIGNELDNVILGNSADNVLDGGAGTDLLAGGNGNDTYILDNPGDNVMEQSGQGTDTIVAHFNHTLTADMENLILAGPAWTATGNALDNAITGTDADNILTGLDGDDVLYGNAGNDLLDGGTGTDTLIGGMGNDSYLADSANDAVVENVGEGVDAVQTSVTYVLGDNVEDLTLTGSANIDGAGNTLDNTLTGNAGNNELAGGAGNDTLTGGAGSDLLLGGNGEDRYIFNLADGNDRIADNQGFNILHFGTGLAVASLEADRVGENMVIHVFDTQDFITLENWFNQTGSDGVNAVTFDDGTVLDRLGIEMLMNQPPMANTDTITVYEDGGALTVPTASLLANDTDPNPDDVLSVVSVGESFVGAGVSMTGGDVVYEISGRFQELAEGEELHDSFSYTVADQEGATVVGLVSVNIVGSNDAPVATADASLVGEDWLTTTRGNVLGNDHDIDNGTVLQVATPGDYAGIHGALSVRANGDFTYQLNNASSAVQALGRDALAVERFGYIATDGLTGAAATIDIFLHGVNDVPVLIKPLADQDFTFNKPFYWQVPADSFTDVDADDALSYTATLADGSSLPDWLRFDAKNLSFSGVAPKAVLSLDIMVTASDSVTATASTEGSLSVSDVFRLSISHGNEGVGNGEDAAPAGQDSNFNDGAGTAPGEPGAKGWKTASSTDAMLTSATDIGTRSESSTSSSDMITSSLGALPKGEGALDGSGSSPSMPSYLGASHWDEQMPLAGEDGAASDPASIFARWLAMDLAVAEALADRQALSWLDDRLGAGIPVLGNAGEGFLGSTTIYGKDVFSLTAGGQDLQSFQGLDEGLKKIA